MSTVLALTFATSDDAKTKTLSISDPKTNLTESEVKAAMNAIIESGVIDVEDAELTAPKKAVYRETNTVEIF